MENTLLMLSGAALFLIGWWAITHPPKEASKQVEPINRRIQQANLLRKGLIGLAILFGLVLFFYGGWQGIM